MFRDRPEQGFYMLLPANKADHMQLGPMTLHNVIHYLKYRLFIDTPGTMPKARHNICDIVMLIGVLVSKM